MDMKWWNTELFRFGEYSITLNQLITALVIVVLTFVLSKLLRRGLSRLGHGRDNSALAQIYVINRILHYVVLTIGFVVAVSSLGIDVGKLALIASALGIGIGLGLQGVVNNFVSGLIILLEKSIKVGDFIELSSGVVGEVKAIHMRATLIRTNDNVDVLIPNSELASGMLTNWTLQDNIRRFRIPFGVAYGSDKTIVKKAALEAALNVKYTLDTQGHEPVVWMTGFGDSALNFTLGVWVNPEQVKRPTALYSDYLWAIDDALRKYDIEIPFPQRDLHIRSSELPVHHSVQN
ncbi:mechanosensitive ion channel [Neptunicella marina]|uniref:Mechanosensitive ion channel n=2 Tax=Neptunicella marina TaxID=2125989 RepID=A0A8J6M0V0_9ALTE|nr:mechanosensitive ion channel [Neptunicella marina]